VVLIEDGPQPESSLAASAATAPHYLRYIVQDHQGPAAARNKAIQSSHGEFIAFLDLDDRWSAGHLHRLLAALQANPEAGIAQGHIRKFLTADDGRLYLCSAPYFFVNLGAALYRRSVFDRCGLFDATLRFGEDFDLIVRCWEQGILKVQVPELSLLYHRHQGNMTNGKSIVDLGAVQVYKRRLDRRRSGLLDPSLPELRRVSFADYLGRTTGPFDEGVREPLEPEIFTGREGP
jgi:glycosyltransferase involved in cell wall biosynthesis